MEYPDAKRSIRLCLGAMHLLRVTTNGLECAAIAQKMVRLCCPKRGGIGVLGSAPWEGLFEMLGSRFPRGLPGFVSPVLRRIKHHFKLINRCQDFTEADKAQVKT